MSNYFATPGNSGSPLANARGQVIGINTMIAGGLALAVPSNVVERFLNSSSRPYLGVTLRPVLVQLENKRLLGLLVLEVHHRSAAQSVGLRSGDVLIGAYGQCFNTPEDLTSILEQAEPGDLLPLEFLRSRSRSYCTVVLPGGKDVFAGVKAT